MAIISQTPELKCACIAESIWGALVSGSSAEFQRGGASDHPDPLASSLPELRLCVFASLR